jgi:hypothetical protein
VVLAVRCWWQTNVFGFSKPLFADYEPIYMRNSGTQRTARTRRCQGMGNCPVDPRARWKYAFIVDKLAYAPPGPLSKYLLRWAEGEEGNRRARGIVLEKMCRT